jgi:hypothetical protein
MAEAGWVLQQAVFAALDGDASLDALIGAGRVFDHVPENQDFPYVTVGEATAVDASTMGKDGQQHTITLHAWSRGRGRKEVKQILGAIHDLLHKSTLAITGHVHAGTIFEFSETFVENDGLTYHGVARYRSVTLDA